MQESGTQSQEPYIGMPVTKNYYTDRHAATIVSVNGQSITVRDNEVQVLDYEAGKYAVLPQLLEGSDRVFTKRKNGRWVAKGQPANKGLGLSLGIEDHYIDPTF